MFIMYGIQTDYQVCRGKIIWHMMNRKANKSKPIKSYQRCWNKARVLKQDITVSGVKKLSKHMKNIF